MDLPRPAGAPPRGPRRVFTAPSVGSPAAESSTGVSSPSSVADGVVETLYVHPSAKIVAFTAGPRNFTVSPKGGDPYEVEPGSLPWSSQIERTIAVGPFRIYRAPGSVAFLSCGSALQPILPKSQCWCIDEVSSKFILQIRRPQYWRIEVPIGNPENDQLAQTLRGVLDTILQFEKTPCPFKRAFTVVLPERPQTPVKKRPWTPVQRTTPIQLPPTPITPAEKTPRARPRDEMPSPAPQLDTTPSQVSRQDLDTCRTPPVKSRVEEIELKTPSSERITNLLEGADQPKDEANVDEQSQAMVENLSVLVAEAIPEEAPGDEEQVLLKGGAMENHEAKPEEIIEPSATISGYEAPETVPPSGIDHGEAPPTQVDADADGDSRSSTDAQLPRYSNCRAEPRELPRVLELPKAQELIAQTRLERNPASTAINVDIPEEAVLDSLEDDPSTSPTTLEGTGTLRTISKRLTSFARLQARRSVTAPPQLTLQLSPPSKTRRQPSASESSEAAESNSPTESFHSVQSWLSPITPLPPSPPISSTGSPDTFPYPHENIRLPKHIAAAHQRDVSDATATPTQAGTWLLSPTGADILSIGSSSATSSVYEDAERPVTDKSQDVAVALLQLAIETEDEIATSSGVRLRSRPDIRNRATTSSISISSRHHRALSPLPPAANLFTPPANRRRAAYARSADRATTRMEAVRRIPGAIIHKTCEILMSPPSHLINLMLKVAARIAAGEWRGLVFGQGEGGEHIPVQWDYTDHQQHLAADEHNFMYPWAEEDGEASGTWPATAGRRASLAPAKSKSTSPTWEARERESRPSSASGSGRSWEVD